jgi:hypothetical protein
MPIEAASVVIFPGKSHKIRRIYMHEDRTRKSEMYEVIGHPA